MTSVVQGAIIGAIIGGAVVIFNTSSKNNKYKNLVKMITGPVEYSALYHYASAKRYKKSFKFFDSYGALYLVGKMVYYKAKEKEAPLTFNLDECSVQAEADWRMLKWFSITNPAGEKFYFNSNKMGAFKNNSDETLKGLAALQAKKVV